MTNNNSDNNFGYSDEDIQRLKAGENITKSTLGGFSLPSQVANSNETPIKTGPVPQTGGWGVDRPRIIGIGSNQHVTQPRVLNADGTANPQRRVSAPNMQKHNEAAAAHALAAREEFDRREQQRQLEDPSSLRNTIECQGRLLRKLEREIKKLKEQGDKD